MTKHWRAFFGGALVALTVILYVIHFMIFRDPRHIFLYFLGDIAFLPVQVLFVTLVIDQLFKAREKQVMLEKLNMVIGTFFSDVGTELVNFCTKFDKDIETLRSKMTASGDWTTVNFNDLARILAAYQPTVDSRMSDLVALREFLLLKRDFLLRLLENQNLLEHESFTELLWSVFHLADELAHRRDLIKLSTADFQHLSGDIKRAYMLLNNELVAYLKHLKLRYPYLFSLALRLNPYNASARAEIQ
jgi:hypothetical protein